MNPIVAWFLTLFASVFIAVVFIAAYLDGKYREDLRRLRREREIAYEKVARVMDANNFLKVRLKTQRSEMMAKEGDR